MPVWYGATSAAGAVFESVLHDVRPPDPAPRVLPNAYLERFLAPVELARPAILVDLTTDGLHAIGLTRAALIESTVRRFPWTAGVAERLRRAVPQADGFVWVSRARDTALSVVLYGEVGGAAAGRGPILRPGGDPPLALAFGRGLQLLRELATEARITVIVPDRR